ncbi:MAG: GDP-mannose 4,6-dehydratase [Ignavibacteria bacterium]|nr:GDP-mannose 4,6-dehydratase [Ignavibacteria bacterium]
MKKALITGITGQDGSYLTELLLHKNYQVHGIIRRASSFNTQRIDHIYADSHETTTNLFLHYGDLSDPGLITEIMFNIEPDEVYHLGSQSHVRVSFEMPEYTGNITGLGTTRILEAMRRCNSKAKFYQASSSEMFGSAPPPHNEQTHFQPQSPYAIAKVFAYWMTVNYRDAYNLFACNGILFNHESPRRGETFVTRKITRAIAHILSGKQHKLFIGNIDAKRDWGFAPEYVEMMWLMLQQDFPDDYVVGTGESHSVKEFLDLAFHYIGIELDWKGVGVERKAFVKSFQQQWSTVLNTGMSIIETDAKYFRPTEVDYLLADISKAKKQLGWEPRFRFSELVKIMMDFDMKQCGLNTLNEGSSILKKHGLDWTTNNFALHNQIQKEVG